MITNEKQKKNFLLNLHKVTKILSDSKKQFIRERLTKKELKDLYVWLNAAYEIYDKEGINLFYPQYYQYEFFESEKRERWIFGGNRSGKTISAIAESVMFARGYHPYKDINIPIPNVGKIYCRNFSVQREAIQPYLLHFIPKSEIRSLSYSRNDILAYVELTNNSRIYFGSYDQKESAQTSTSFFWVMFDEEPPEGFYKESWFRLLDQKGYMWGACTPLYGMLWLFHKIFLNEDEDNEIQYFYWDSENNAYLDKDELDRILAKCSPEERETRKTGKFMGFKGLVYPPMRSNYIYYDPSDFYIPAEWPKIRIIDPASTGSTAVLWMAISPDPGFYFYREYKQPAMKISDHCSRIKALSGNEKYVYDIIDPFARAKNPETRTSIYILYKKNLYNNPNNMFLKFASNPHMEGILKVLEYMYNSKKRFEDGDETATPFIRINKNLKKLKNEGLRYHWGAQTNSGRIDPVQKNCDLMDCLRYGCLDKFDVKELFRRYSSLK